MINVLIIEDEHAIRRFLRTALEADGMRVFEAETLQRGLIEAATRKPVLAILDLGLPDGDGIDFIRDLRQWSQMPIIVLSARSEEHDKIAALDAGADDYLSKPFGSGELQARLRVALRRHGAAQADEPVVRFADLEVNIPARRILRGKKLGVVIVDYLQLISPPSGGHRADSRATEVGEMSRGIKIMAKDLEVPVITLSQLNRTVENRTGKRPQLSDLRESGSIEQDADIVALLDRSMNEEEAAREDRPAMGETTFIIAKNRSGALADVPLTFLPGSTKFVEIDKQFRGE